MKKGIIAIMAVLVVAPAVFAENWGLGLKLGGGRNAPTDLNDYYDNTVAASKEKTEGPVYGGLEVMYEFNLNDETNKIGVKAGVDIYADNEVKLTSIGLLPGLDDKITETTYAFPFTVYYKKDNGVQNWSWFGGAGVTILKSTVEEIGVPDESKTKVFPHIVAGGEYRFTEVFALGLEARYNFSAKVKKNGGILSDRSGFGAALTGRFYF